MSKYPGIPEFSDDLGLAMTVRAIKEIVEQLAGQRTGESIGAPSVFVQQVAPSTLLDATHKVGDFWIRPGPPAALSFWDGVKWVQAAP